MRTCLGCWKKMIPFFFFLFPEWEGWIALRAGEVLMILLSSDPTMPEGNSTNGLHIYMTYKALRIFVLCVKPVLVSFATDLSFYLSYLTCTNTHSSHFYCVSAYQTKWKNSRNEVSIEAVKHLEDCVIKWSFSLCWLELDQLKALHLLWKNLEIWKRDKFMCTSQYSPNIHTEITIKKTSDKSLCFYIQYMSHLTQYFWLQHNLSFYPLPWIELVFKCWHSGVV